MGDSDDYLFIPLDAPLKKKKGVRINTVIKEKLGFSPRKVLYIQPSMFFECPIAFLLKKDISYSKTFFLNKSERKSTETGDRSLAKIGKAFEKAFTKKFAQRGFSIKVQKPIYLLIYKKSTNSAAYVLGRVDIYVPERNMIIELKTTINEKDLEAPKLDHILQILLYVKATNAESALLVYSRAKYKSVVEKVVNDVSSGAYNNVYRDEDGEPIARTYFFTRQDLERYLPILEEHISNLERVHNLKTNEDDFAVVVLDVFNKHSLKTNDWQRLCLECDIQSKCHIYSIKERLIADTELKEYERLKQEIKELSSMSGDYLKLFELTLRLNHVQNALTRHFKLPKLVRNVLGETFNYQINPSMEVEDIVESVEYRTRLNIMNSLVKYANPLVGAVDFERYTEPIENVFIARLVSGEVFLHFPSETTHYGVFSGKLLSAIQSVHSQNIPVLSIYYAPDYKNFNIHGFIPPVLDYQEKSTLKVIRPVADFVTPYNLLNKHILQVLKKITSVEKFLLPLDEVLDEYERLVEITHNKNFEDFLSVLDKTAEVVFQTPVNNILFNDGLVAVFTTKPSRYEMGGYLGEIYPSADEAYKNVIKLLKQYEGIATSVVGYKMYKKDHFKRR